MRLVRVSLDGQGPGVVEGLVGLIGTASFSTISGRSRHSAARSRMSCLPIIPHTLDRHFVDLDPQPPSLHELAALGHRRIQARQASGEVPLRGAGNRIVVRPKALSQEA